MAFPLKTREDLRAVDLVCLGYGVRNNFLVVDCPALRLLFDELVVEGIEEREKWRRIALAWEIKLGFVQTLWDLSTVAGIENKVWVPRHKGELASIDPLRDVETFATACNRARSLFSLVIRLRAIWEKLFLYVGSINGGEAFLRIARGKGSPRRAFFRLFGQGVGNFSAEDVQAARDCLEKLESQYRTPELHGEGALRTWAFDPITDWPVPSTSELLHFWNLLQTALFKSFEKANTRLSSFEGMAGTDLSEAAP